MAENSDAMDQHNQIHLFLALRQQNVELLRVAARVAGYTGEKPPGKPDEVRQALDRIYDVYSEFYAWVDPEQAEDEDEES
jgi:hypothetical protein